MNEYEVFLRSFLASVTNSSDDKRPAIITRPVISHNTQISGFQGSLFKV